MIEGYSMYYCIYHYRYLGVFDLPVCVCFILLELPCNVKEVPHRWALTRHNAVCVGGNNELRTSPWPRSLSS